MERFQIKCNKSLQGRENVYNFGGPFDGAGFAYKPVVGSNSPRISICSGGSATYVVDVILSPRVPPVLFDKNHGKCLIFPL